MRTTTMWFVSAIAATVLAAAVLAQDRPRRNSDRPDTPASQRGQPRGPQGEFRTDVPDHAVDVILGRPTGNSVTLSLLAYADAKAHVAYGMAKDDLSLRTDTQELKKGLPLEVVLGKLKADTRYYYQVRDEANKPVCWGAIGSARSTPSGQPAAPSCLPCRLIRIWTRTRRRNFTAERWPTPWPTKPDFHIDLGDTFMTDKHASRDSAAKQYLAQRYYMGLIGQSAPVFLVLGNHDGEDSKLLCGGADSLAVWSNAMRKRYFRNPLPDAFYAGNSTKDPLAGMLQDYYSWEWGRCPVHRPQPVLALAGQTQRRLLGPVAGQGPVRLAQEDARRQQGEVQVRVHPPTRRWAGQAGTWRSGGSALRRMGREGHRWHGRIQGAQARLGHADPPATGSQPRVNRLPRPRPSLRQAGT